MPEFDPRDLIDRKAEQELFAVLVSYNSPARMLTICDRGGRGKSTLLKRLQYNCQYEINPAVPVCLVELDHLTDPTSFALVTSIVQGFKAPRNVKIRERFAKFRALNAARTIGDFSAFAGSGDFRGTDPRMAAYVRAASVTEGGIATGFNTSQGDIRIGQVRLGPREGLSDEQDRFAKERCVDAFFDDLRTICATQPMVLMLDAWERCNLELRNWIRDELLGNRFLSPDPHLRPDRLALVIAGRPYAPPATRFGLRPDEFRPLFDSAEEFEATVLSIKALSEWDEEHVSRFMQLNGCSEPSEWEISFIQNSLRTRLSLVEALGLIDQYLRG